jgi:RNA polymerase sporulation-specific sigma factor
VKERQVIQLRFFHGLTQTDCARILKISQVQVSRLEKKAVEALRSLMS